MKNGQNETWGQAFLSAIIILLIGFGILWLIGTLSDEIALLLGRLWIWLVILLPFFVLYLVLKDDKK